MDRSSAQPQVKLNASDRPVQFEQQESLTEPQLYLRSILACCALKIHAQAAEFVYKRTHSPVAEDNSFYYVSSFLAF